MSSSKCLWTLAFTAQRIYRHVNANTLIGAAILFPGHPYIWATLLRAHNILLLGEDGGSTGCRYLYHT